MRFKDIPRFTGRGHYSVSVPWAYLPERIHREQTELGLELCPDFQRGHVWTEAQQQAYIEFCLRGGQSARTLYFNHPGWMKSFQGEYVLVDGLQRLTAVLRFLENKLSIFSGMRYGDFEDKLDVVDDTFTFNINSLKTRKEVLTWYLEMNEGGVVHTQEELATVHAMMLQES